MKKVKKILRDVLILLVSLTCLGFTFLYLKLIQPLKLLIESVSMVRTSIATLTFLQNRRLAKGFYSIKELSYKQEPTPLLQENYLKKMLLSTFSRARLIYQF